MKKNWLLLGALIVSASMSVFADDFEDDIYFNPSKQKTASTKKKSTASNYIKDFDQQDVDAYNRRGQYYTTPVDTIGDYAASGEDFVYTQRIQQFYNPTIVVENADLLQSVLDNSYGNVEVVYNIDGPVLSPLYSPWTGYVPASWYSPYYINPGWSIGWYSPNWYGPSWSFGWNFGPVSWSWGYGPSWSYGPGWGWGGSWGWGGGWRPPHWHAPVGRPHYAQWTPGRNSVNRPGYRGGYNYVSNHGVSRPGSGRPVGTRPGTVRPGSIRPSSTGRPGTSVTRPGSTTARPGTSVGRPTTSRPVGTSVGGTRGSSRRPESAVTSTTRPSTSTSTTRPSTSTSTTRPGSSATTGRGSSNSSTSVSRPTTSTNRGSSTVSRPSSSSSRGSSAGRSSGGSRSSGGRGGRR